MNRAVQQSSQQPASPSPHKISWLFPQRIAELPGPGVSSLSSASRQKRMIPWMTSAVGGKRWLRLAVSRLHDRRCPRAQAGMVRPTRPSAQLKITRVKRDFRRLTSINDMAPPKMCPAGVSVILKSRNAAGSPNCRIRLTHSALDARVRELGSGSAQNDFAMQRGVVGMRVADEADLRARLGLVPGSSQSDPVWAAERRRDEAGCLKLTFAGTYAKSGEGSQV